MDDFEAALKQFVTAWLERGKTPFAVARHMLLVAGALLSVHEQLEDQRPQTDYNDLQDAEDRP